ncbi:MAG: hypothetical protein JXJ22_02115 [Bacteroidales bacterium]|nr:hypothetical protein [Bacteroidales bacterium]
MKTIKISIYILLITLSGKGISASNLSPTTDTINYKFSSSQLMSDFKIFRQALENEHGGIYRYTSKKEMTMLFDSVQTLINDSMNIFSFYSMLTACVAKINCEHTNVTLPNILNDILDKEKVFPVILFKNQYVTYVEHNYSRNKNIIEGSQIKGINNKSIEDINNTIFRHLSSDGNIASSKYRRLSGINFPLYYKMFVSDTGIFKVDYVTPGGTCQSAIVYADTLKKIKKEYELDYEKKIDKNISFEMLQLSDSLDVAFLKIKRFRLNEEHSHIIDSVFKYISDNAVERIIIDIRDNKGGAGANYLYSYLTNQKFVFVDSAIIRTRKFNYVKKYSGSSKFIKLLNKTTWLFTKKINSEKYLVKKNFITNKLGADEMGIQQPSSINNFTGKVYLMINGLTLSEASIFSAVVHYNKRAIIIGEESGGSYYGPTSSIVPKIELPITKIRFTIPLVEIHTPVSGIEYGKGTLPHYDVQENIGDRISNTDAILNFTLKLIGNE